MNSGNVSTRVVAVTMAAAIGLLLSGPSGSFGQDKGAEYQGYVEPARNVEMKISIAANQAIHYAQVVREVLGNQQLAEAERQGRACYNLAKFEDAVHDVVLAFVPRNAERKLYAPLAEYSRQKAEPLYARVLGLGGFAGETTDHVANPDDVVGAGQKVKLLVRLIEYEKELDAISNFHFKN